MELKDIRTRKEFAEYLLEWDELQVEAADLDEVISWFVAMQEAAMVRECGQADIARLFLSGVKGIRANPDEAIENWLETIWEDVDSMYECGQEEEALKLEEEQALMLEELLRIHFSI